MSEDLGPVIRAILVAVPWVGVWHLTRMAGARPRILFVIVAGAVASIVVVELGMQRRLPVEIPIGALLVSNLLLWRHKWLIRVTGGPRPEVGALLGLFEVFRDPTFAARNEVPSRFSALEAHRTPTTAALIDVARELATEWLAGSELRTDDQRLTLLSQEIRLMRQRVILAGVDPRLVAYESNSTPLGE